MGEFTQGLFIHFFIQVICTFAKVSVTSTQSNLAGLVTAMTAARYELIPAWISNYMPNKVWDVIAYPFPNFNSCTIEVWEWISNFIPHFLMDVITYPYWD